MLLSTHGEEGITSVHQFCAHQHIRVVGLHAAIGAEVLKANDKEHLAMLLYVREQLLEQQTDT